MTGQLSIEHNADQQQCDPATIVADNTKSTFQKRLKRVLNRQENRICLDCSQPGPRWASIISIPPPTDGPINPCNHDFSFGGFCCLECSGAHRTLGTHLNFVRSVDFDSLNAREIRALEMTGNASVNSIFEGRLFSAEVGGHGGIAVSFTKEIKPDASSDQNTRELFIKNKYSKKMYLDIVALNQFHRTLAASIEFPVGGSNLMLSPSPSTESSVAPPQLQIFTTSPRTLAMLEKYMNPKPKKKKLSKRIKAALGMTKNLNDESDDPRSSICDPMVNMPTTLKILQPRSISESVEEFDAYSDGEYNIELVKREGRIRTLVDPHEHGSVTSTKSSMSATRRRRWITLRRKKLRYRRKSKRLRKAKSEKPKLPLATTSTNSEFSFNDYDNTEPKPHKDSQNSEYSTLLRPPLPKPNITPKLHIVDEDCSHYSKESDNEKHDKARNRDIEISIMTLWSRGLEWAILRRFRTQTN